MSLLFYINTPFNDITAVDEVDVATGDGFEIEFPLEHKLGARVGNSIQIDDLLVARFLQQFFITEDNTIVFADPPADDAVIVIPGVNTILFDAYDTDDVPNVVNPRISEIQFYLADVADIATKQYEAQPGEIGIKICVEDLIADIGAITTLIQLACANPDGSAGTYGTPGACLFTREFTAFGALQISSVSGASSMTVNNAVDFNLGDYVVINPGTGTQEIKKLISRSGSILTFQAQFTYTHFGGELMFDMGRMFYGKATIPEGFADGEATSLYDLVFTRYIQIVSRV